MPSKTKRSIFSLLIIIAIIAAVFLLWPKKSVAPETIEGSAFVKTTASTQADTNWQIVASSIKAAVLMYHHVGPLPEHADTIRKGLTVSTEEFDNDLKYLSENGYTITSLSSLSKYQKSSKVPEKLAILTFDDGYSDNFDYAWPVMKKYKAMGTFFIITGKIGQNEHMNEDQIEELVNSGNEIGSHTVNHIELDKYKGETLTGELFQSKETLEKLLGKSIVSFCYPSGKYNENTEKAVEEAGYKYAVTTKSSLGEIDLGKLFEIPRYRMSAGRNLEAMLR